VSVELLLDNSAWARMSTPGVAEERCDEIADALEQRRIAVCLPFLLEAGYSARSAPEHQALMRELMALPHLRFDAEVERRAVDAQDQLARAGHHRLPPVDKTDLRFRSVWLAPRGTL
jgi:predicted nucleic acid-binding protein